MTKRKRPSRRPTPAYPDTPSGRGSHMYETLYNAIHALPQSGPVQVRLGWSFWGDSAPNHVEEADEPAAVVRFMDWACYGFALPPGGETLAELALQRLASSVDSDELERLRAFCAPRYAIYRVVRATPEQERFEAEDTQTGDCLVVHERLGSRELTAGNILIGALHQVPEGWVMSGGVAVYPALDFTLPAQEGTPEPAALAPALERTIYGAGSDWILDCDLRELREAYEAFVHEAGHTGLVLPSLRSIQQRIADTDSPANVMSDILHGLDLWTLAEAELLLHFVQRLWNLTPRAELGGRSPEEMAEASGSGGPQEIMLMEQCMDWVQKQLRGKSERVLERRGNELIQELMHKWLNKPRRDLDGRTPMEVIARERIAIAGIQLGGPGRAPRET